MDRTLPTEMASSSESCSDHGRRPMDGNAYCLSAECKSVKIGFEEDDDSCC